MNLNLFVNEASLVVSAICGMGIVHLRSIREPDTPWYYYYALWGVSLVCMFQLSDDLVVKSMHVDMHRIYLPRLALGAERLSVFIAYRYGIGQQVSVRFALLASRINHYLLISSVLIITAAVAYSLWLSPSQALDEKFTRLEREVKKNRSVSAGDTARVVAMQKTIDTLTNQLSQVRADNAGLQHQLSIANARLADLADLLVSLKRAVSQLGQSVERSRKSVVLPNTNYLKPKGVSGEIPTGKVQPPPTTQPATRRGRRETAVYDWDDPLATYYEF